jgi:inosine-uridine nucleoside N-ribohydrolase
MLTIIDTDPGIDDAMAILLALSSDKLRVVALTIVHGNLGVLDPLVRNARRVLALAQRRDVRVVRGASQPMSRQAHPGAPFVHGDDGMGDVALNEGELDALVEADSELSAAAFLVEESRRPEGLHVVALGPLTNLALAQELDASFGSRVKLYAMGGCFLVPGNVSTNAEANVWNDPEAANLVFSSFASVVLAPLDVTTSVKWGADYAARLRKAAPRIGGFIEQITRKYLAFHHHAMGRDNCDFHDSSAVLSLIAPELFSRQEQHWVRVETRDGLTRGLCVADFRNSLENAVDFPKTVTLMLATDAAACLDFFAEAIARLERRLT